MALMASKWHVCPGNALIMTCRVMLPADLPVRWSLNSHLPPAASGEGEHEHLVPSNKVAKIAAGQATDTVAEKSRILAPLLGEAKNGQRDSKTLML